MKLMSKFKEIFEKRVRGKMEEYAFDTKRVGDLEEKLERTRKQLEANHAPLVRVQEIQEKLESHER